MSVSVQRHPWRANVVLALTSVLLVGVAACDSSTNEAPTATTSPATTSPATTAPTTTLAGSAAVASAASTTAVTTSPVTTAAAAAATAVTTTVAPTTTAAPTTTVAVPRHIVSLSPTATEMLFAIGAGDQVVAVDDQSNFPAEAEAKASTLSGLTPNVEAIAAYHPDLVVISDDSQHLIEQLGKLGIAVWLGPAAVTFDDVYAQITQLGAATGHAEFAAALVTSMRVKIAVAVASVPKLSKAPSYYHELDNTFFSATSTTFVGQVYSLFGLRNIADAAGAGTDYPQLNAEFIIGENPDLVFLADGKCCGESPATVAARAGWANVAAVVADDVVLVDDDVASRWGPRLVDYVEIVAAAVQRVAQQSAG
jgi:iron complex transport system substrate-binding protein